MGGGQKDAMTRKQAVARDYSRGNFFTRINENARGGRGEVCDDRSYCIELDRFGSLRHYAVSGLPSTINTLAPTVVI